MKTLTVIGELLHPENIWERYKEAIAQKDYDIFAYAILSTPGARRIGLSPSSSLEDLYNIVNEVIAEETKIIEESDAECLFLEGRVMRERFLIINKKIKWTNILIHTYYLRKIQHERASNNKPKTIHTKYFDKWDNIIMKNIKICLQKYNSVLAIVGMGHLEGLEKTVLGSDVEFHKIEIPSWNFSQVKANLNERFEYLLKEDNLTI